MAAARRSPKAPATVPWTGLAPCPNFREIPLAQVRPDPAQPRREFPEAELAGLAASLKARGQLQAIRVVEVDGEPGHYQIVSGERRFRAAQEAGLFRIRAEVVERGGAGRTFLDQVAENLQRADLSPLDEAAAYRRAIDEGGLSHRELAAELGLADHSRITRALALLELPEEVRALVAAGELAPSTAGLLRRLPDEWERVDVARMAASTHGSEPWTRAQVEAEIARRLAPPPPPAVHRAPDETAAPGARSKAAAPAEGSAGGADPGPPAGPEEGTAGGSGEPEDEAPRMAGGYRPGACAGCGRRLVVPQGPIDQIPGVHYHPARDPIPPGVAQCNRCHRRRPLPCHPCPACLCPESAAGPEEE